MNCSIPFPFVMTSVPNRDQAVKLVEAWIS